MCGRFTLHHDEDEILTRFGATPAAFRVPPRYNVAPTQSIPVIMGDGTRTLREARWGLIPAWAKDATIGNKMINARAETVAEKPSYKTALSRRRCLIPADGFYEWKRDGTARTPYHFRLRDGNLFAFAGLWDEWRDPDGEMVLSCTLITTAANDVVAPVHDRMPVILLPEDEAHWLDTSVHEARDLVSFLHPYPADQMESFSVSRRVNSPASDGPELLLAA